MVKNHFMNGIAELIILSLLENNDCYTYEMVKGIEVFSEGLLSISQNTLYTVVYKLEREGKISEYSKLVGKKRTRVYYKLEKGGAETLKELRADYENVLKGVENIMRKLESGEVDDID